jgi:predicted Zn-dependent peptidase
MTIELTTLPSGLRIITDRNKEVDSAAIGVWVDVGTRNEDLENNGIAHMVEHMMFSGTKTRTSKDIVEQIENVGGQVNAYTSREITAYYIHLLKEDVGMGLEVLADMLQNSQFPDKELEKERGVILQEIGMTNDTPDDVIFDYYQETAYPGQALGAPILGTSDIVKSIKKQSLHDYVTRFYTPKNLVISAAGNINPDDIIKKTEMLFSTLPADNDNTGYIKAGYKGGEFRKEKQLEQSHIILGFKGVDRASKDYFPAMLMSTIMGGGMSSRLFQEVREKRGLVYSVFSSHASYHDDGQFEIYAGTGPDKLAELMPVLCEETRKLRTNLVGENELSRAKSQIKASLLMGMESMMGRTNRQAKYLINFGEKINLGKMVKQIDAVSREDIKNIAEKIFTGKPTLAALGPVSSLENYEDLQKQLLA